MIEAEFADALLASQTLKDDTDLLFGRELAAGLTTDLLDGGLGGLASLDWHM